MTITDNPTKNKQLAPPGEAIANSDDYRVWRDAVAGELQARGHFDEAERWDYCNDSPRYKLSNLDAPLPDDVKSAWVCSASHEHHPVLFCISCDNRCCPDCAPRHSARLVARYVDAIGKLISSNPKYRLRTLIFTRTVELGSPGFKEIAQYGFKLIQRALKKVVGPDWNKDGAGLLVNWEVGPNGLKLHYHAVYFGKWVDQRKLSKAWKELTGDSFVVWVSAVKHNDGDWQKAVVETLKYATKFYLQDKTTGERIYLSPNLTVDLFEALKDTRRIRSYGSLFRIEPPTERAFLCEECNSKMVRIGVEYFEIWRNTGFSEGEWREIATPSLLQSRIANKSPPNRAKQGQVNQNPSDMLPGFAEIPIKGTSHYDD